MEYKATTYPDTMYLNEDMNQLNSNKFNKDIQKEWDYQMENKNFSIIPQLSIL